MVNNNVSPGAEKQVKKLKLDFCNKVYLDDEPYNSFLASQESN